jgi:hypothetical protein
MNKTCLFLIFLIAPLAFCQHEILNMLDNTAEGKEVLDALFVQTKLMGDNLDAASLRQFLNNNYKRAQSEKAEIAAQNKKRSADCKSDLKQLAAFLHEHEDRKLELKRRVEFVKRASKVNGGFLNRADEELSNYRKFAEYIHKNKEAWTLYYKTVTTNFASISNILKSARSALRPRKGAAFVEVAEDSDVFSTNLAEIKLQVEATDAEFVGMGPILSNLVEIMAEAVNKSDVRQKTKELVSLLIDNVRDRVEEIEEENDPNWRSTVVSLDVNYHYERSIENGLDPAHNEYVHPTHGNRGEKEEEYRRKANVTHHKHITFSRGHHNFVLLSSSP